MRTAAQRPSLLNGGKVLRGMLASVLAVGVSVGVAAAALGGKVVAVTDGDTIKVLDAGKVQHVVRLSGIDAPERKMPFGQRSRQYEREQSPTDRQIYAEAEIKAATAKQGLWSERGPVAPWDWRKERRRKD